MRNDRRNKHKTNRQDVYLFGLRCTKMAIARKLLTCKFQNPILKYFFF